MKVFAENRKARNSYEFQEFYEAGIVLTGPETKSIRQGAVSIVDDFASLIDYDPKKPRKLLLHKKEIKRLIGLISQKGYTLVATKLFESNGFVKVELALAKGKKDYDKRSKIVDKQHRKEIKNY